MEQPILIIVSLTLLGVIAFVFLYLTNEKKKKATRGAELEELKQLLATVQNRIQETASQLTEKFENLAKDVRTAQDQANAKINSGFDQLQTENSNVQKDVRNNIAEIKTAFKDYSENVKEALRTYSNDNADFKKDAEQLRTKIQTDLQNILKEIKTPLDLD